MSSKSTTATPSRFARRFAIFALVALLPLATQAASEESAPYSALDTVRRAQIGTFSPRLAPPVRVEKEAPKAPPRFERMECRPDPSRPLNRAIICTPRSNKKLN